MSDRWPNRSYVQALFRPPRRAFLAIGTVAVPASLLVGGDPTTAGLVGFMAFMLFFMGHVERKMHPRPTGARRNSDHEGEHSGSESADHRPHSTTTITEED